MQKKKSLDELMNKYVECALLHGEGTNKGDYKLTNKSHDLLVKSKNQILTFGKEGRDAILKLMDHENPSVRGWAATHSLEYNAPKAERVLGKLSKGYGLVGLSAETVLEEWRKGKLKLA